MLPRRWRHLYDLSSPSVTVSQFSLPVSQFQNRIKRRCLNLVHWNVRIQIHSFDINENRKVRSDRVTLSMSLQMDPEGNVPETVSKSVLNQTDVSTGIGPTGTDTPAPKDIMPRADHLEHSVEEPLSRPPGALFQVGSGVKGDRNEKIPEPISEEQPETNGTVAKSQEK